ncbi:tyrosine-type recombinase/integrase [Bordetella pseudohinzii]|nr:site-specific integrase [Bordetella pseudohinzii]
MIHELAPVTHNLGHVVDDWAAAEVWLQVLVARRLSPATLDTYQREIRRLHWYCRTQAAQTPARWNYQDVLAYGEFLKLRASEHVCPAGLRPDDPRWTPFRGPLAESSLSDAHKILRGLFNFWHQAGYIPRNPYSGWGQANPLHKARPSHRAVPGQLLDVVMTKMDLRPKRTAIDHLIYYRNRFLILLLLGTGLRAHEALACNMTDVGQHTDPLLGDVYWGLQLREEKGGGSGNLAYLDELVIDAFHIYREAFGLPADPPPNEDNGLILSPLTDRSAGGKSATGRRRRTQWRTVRTRQTAWNIVKAEFTGAALALRDEGETAAAALLERVSTHWLRHTRATELVLSGHDMRVVAEMMRHKDIRTTMRYTNLEFFDLARQLRASRPIR